MGNEPGFFSFIYPTTYIEQSQLKERVLKGESLDDSDTVGNVKGVEVGGQTNVGLLGSVGADEGVDAVRGDVELGLDGVLDLPLVGGDVDDEKGQTNNNGGKGRDGVGAPGSFPLSTLSLCCCF